MNIVKKIIWLESREFEGKDEIISELYLKKKKYEYDADGNTNKKLNKSICIKGDA